ncbi:hypothetical protein JKP88DRAFT_261878 [Tribonema minus]|uniref:Uncharacterized protein n=1 Tax=Tribonema minus TaxID=303371 RepID=A0A836CLJ5_9STRA|nr:hypothetical protein JKP88DRAFT_261878 [Tribonema minus]
MNSKPTERDSSIQNGGGSATSNDAAQSQPAPFSGQTVSRKTFASKNLNAHALTKAPVNNAPRAATRFGAGGRLLVLTGNKAPSGPAAASAPTSSAALRGTNSAQDDGASAGTGTPSWGAAKDSLSAQQQPAGGSPSLAPASAKAKTPWSSGGDAAPAGGSVGIATLKSSEFPDLGRENEPRPPPLQLRPGGSSGARAGGSLAGCDSQAQHPPNGVTVGSSSSSSSPGNTYDTAATAVLSPPIAPAAAPARSSSSGSGTVADESARTPAAWGRASQQSTAPTAGGTSPPGERWTRGSAPVARGFSDRSGGGGSGDWRQQRGGGDGWSAQDGREQQHYVGSGRSWPDVPRRAVERRASGEGAADFGSSAQRPRQGSYEAGRPGWRERSSSNADARPPVRGFNAVGGGGGADASRNWREGGWRLSIDETVSGAATQRRDSPHSTSTSPQLNSMPSPQIRRASVFVSEQAIAGEAQRTAEREAALAARDGDEVATAAALRARHELERLRAEREQQQQQQQCAATAPQRASYSTSVAADPYSVVTEPAAELAAAAGASSSPLQPPAHSALQQQAAAPSPLTQPWRAPAALRSSGFSAEPRRPLDAQQHTAAVAPNDAATKPAHPAQQRTEPQPLGWHPSPPPQQQPQVRALLARPGGDAVPRLAADGSQKGAAISSSDPFAAQPRGAGRLYDPKTGLVAAVIVQAAPAVRALRAQPQTRASGSPHDPLTSSAVTGEASAAGSPAARGPAGAPAAAQQLQQQNADAAAAKQRREQAAAAAAQKQEDRAQRRREQRAARVPRTSGALYCRDAAGTVLSADGAGDPHLGAWRRLASAATPAPLRRAEGSSMTTAAAGAAAVQVAAAMAAQQGSRAADHVDAAAATPRETNKERRQRKQLGVALDAEADVAVAAARAAAADPQAAPQEGGVGAGRKQSNGAPCELPEAAEQSEADAQAAETKKLERKEKRAALAAQRVERWTLQREAKRAAKAVAAASQTADCEPAAAAAADVAGDGAQPLGAASAAAAAEEPADGAASSNAAAAAQPSLRWHGSRLLEELPPDAVADVACIQFGTLLAGSDAAADAADDAEHAPAELALQSAAEHEGVRTGEDADGARHSSAGVGDAHSPVSHAAGVPDGVAVIPVAAAAAEPQSSGAGAGSAAAALAQQRTTAAREGAEQAAAAVSSNVAAMPPQPAVWAVCAPPQAAPAFTSMSASFPMHVAYHGSSGEPVAALDGSWVWSTAVAAGACAGGPGEHYGVAPLQQYAQPVWYDSGAGVVRSAAAAAPAACAPVADDGWVTKSADGFAPPQHALVSQQQQRFQQQGGVEGPAAAAESQSQEGTFAPTVAEPEGWAGGGSSSGGAAAQLSGSSAPPMAGAQEDEAAAPGASDAVLGGNMAQPADKDLPSERARRPRGGKKHTAKMNNKANSGKAPADGAAGRKATGTPPAAAPAAAAAATIATAAAASNSAAATAPAANSTAAAAAAPDAAPPADAAAPSDNAAKLWTTSKPQKGKKGAPAAAAAAAVAAESPRSGTDGSACPEAENKRANGGKSRKGGRKGAGTPPPPPPQQQQQSPTAQSAAQAPQQQGAQPQQQQAAAGEDGRKKAGRKPWWVRRDTKRDQHKARGGDGAQQQRAQTAVGA